MVRLSGEITAANAERIGRRLVEAARPGPAVLEVDLRNVTRLNTAGGTAFFMAWRAARAGGTSVSVTHVRRQPLGTLRRLGLARALGVYEGAGPRGRPRSEL
ncbi:STAS domain-containing protein [Streptomyces sp. NPDC096205]|uniref:STAS domain-containing protein n=1 Tax=Streptomyces sp. NPDC096205 TaxID=3366081 RepID=UPI0038060325